MLKYLGKGHLSKDSANQKRTSLLCRQDSLSCFKNDRCFVSEATNHSLTLSPCLTTGKVINGKVVSVHKGYVTVDNGAYTGQWDLEYDWLVLAPGSSYADGPIKTFCSSAEERQAMIQVRGADSWRLILTAVALLRMRTLTAVALLRMGTPTAVALLSNAHPNSWWKYFGVWIPGFTPRLLNAFVSDSGG